MSAYGSGARVVPLAKNKFIQIANIFNIDLENLIIPKSTLPTDYWHYEREGEKIGTIFIHIAVDTFTEGYSIFENHAGCEKGYFITKNDEHIPLPKYQNRALYKAGDKTQIIFIPDLILVDESRKKVINSEGKKYCNKDQGIKELNNYDYIEAKYIKKYYPGFDIIRTVILYGSDDEVIKEAEVGFLLNRRGKQILGSGSPRLFEDAILRLKEFWGISE